MRRVGCILASLVLCLTGLAGAQTLRLASWQWEDLAYQEFWIGTTEAFSEANPGVEFERFAFPIDQLWDRLNLEIAAGTAPDLIEVTGFNVFQYTNQGVLAPLNACFEGTNIVQNVTAQDSYAVDGDGNMYALNLSARTLQLYVNLELFNEAGVEVPTNFETFMAAAKALTDPDKEQFGLVLTNTASSRLYEGVLEMVAGYGGHYTKDGQPAFDSPEVIKGVQFFKDLFDAGVMPQGVDGAGSQYSWFNSGKVAMTIDGAWYWSTLEQDATDVLSSVKIHKIPTDSGLPTGGVNNLIGISAQSENYDLACEYLKFIATPEWGKVWTDQSRTASTTEGSVTPDFLEANPWFEVFAEELPKAVPVAAPGLEIYHDDIVNMVSSRVVEVLYDNVPAADAMAALQEDVEEYLADQ